MSFVVYSHTRLDKNEVFYIGIGYLKRAYTKRSRNIHWKRITDMTEWTVTILHEGLTWEQACDYEKFYIQKYGRSDLKKGTLCNMTDGGDGKVGYVFSEESKKKIGESNKGKLAGEKNPFFGKKHPPELTAQIEAKKKLNPRIPTPEQKEKWSSKMRGRKIHDEDSIGRISINMPHQRPIDVWKDGKYIGRWTAYSKFIREELGFRVRSETDKQYRTAASKICGMLNGRNRLKTYKGYVIKDVMPPQEKPLEQ